MDKTLERRAGQVSRIFAYLMRGNKITPKNAEDLFGCMRLGARIADIKSRYHIFVKSVLQWNGDKTKRWAVYSIPEEERDRWTRENASKNETEPITKLFKD